MLLSVLCVSSENKESNNKSAKYANKLVRKFKTCSLICKFFLSNVTFFLETHSLAKIIEVKTF